jgi:hypothetical protein
MQMKTGRVAGIVMIVGAVVAVVGSFLTWAKMSIAGISQIPGTSGSYSINGFAHGASDGYFICGCAVVAAVIGAVFLRRVAKGLAVLAILASLVAIGLGIYDFSQAKDLGSGQMRDKIKSEAMAQAPGGLTPQQESQLTQIIDQLLAGLTVTVGPGLYLVILGGVAMLVGSGMSFAVKSAPAQGGEMQPGMPVPPPPADASAASWATPTSPAEESGQAQPAEPPPMPPATEVLSVEPPPEEPEPQP